MDPYERETVLSWNDGDETVSFWTCRPQDVRKIEKLTHRQGVSVKKEGRGYWATFPKSSFRWGLAKFVSPENRAKLTERLAEARKAKKG